jgi:hypothetical protein
MSLRSVLSVYSAMLLIGALVVVLWVGYAIRQRVQRASALEEICRDGDGQSIAKIRSRAAAAGVAVHESAGSVLLRAETRLPPGTLFCHFDVAGEAVFGSRMFAD